MHKIVSFLEMIIIAGSILIADGSFVGAAGRRATTRRSAYDMASTNYAVPETVSAAAEAPVPEVSEVVKPAEEAKPVAEFWFADIHSALELARRENRPLLVHFYTQGCVPCRRMEVEVLSTSEIKKTTAEYYIPVKIDGSQNSELAQQFYVKNYPCDFILNPEGKIVSRLVGLQTQMTYQTFLSQTAQQMGFEPLSAREEVAAAKQVVQEKPAMEDASEELAEISVSETVPELEPVQEPAAEHGVESEGTLEAPSFAEKIPVNVLTKEDSAPKVPQENVTDVAKGEQGAQEVPINMDFGIPLMLDGYCPVALVEQKNWVKGDARFGVRHRGCLYLFETQEAMDKFFAQPDYYALASEGMDVVTLTNSGEQKPGQRQFGIRYDNINFVFSTSENREIFRADPEIYVSKIRQNILETARTRNAEER